jgi:hypothetical protein
LLSRGHGRKNDDADATSVGIAALTAPGLHTVAIDDAVLALRALVDRQLNSCLHIMAITQIRHDTVGCG